MLISVVSTRLHGAQFGAVEQTRSLSNIITALSAQLALVLNMWKASPFVDPPQISVTL